MYILIVFSEDEVDQVVQVLGPFQSEEKAIEWGLGAFGKHLLKNGGNWCEHGDDPVFTVKTLVQPTN